MRLNFQEVEKDEQAVCFLCEGKTLSWFSDSGYSKGKRQGFCETCQIWTFFDIKEVETCAQ